MKANKKVVFLLASIPVTTFLFPILAVHLAPADAVMAIVLFLVLTLYPIQSIIIGATTGSNVRRLWWLLLCLPVLFPLFFQLAFFEIIWEIWIYSVEYLLIGAASTLIAYLSYRHDKWKKENRS